MRKIRYGVQFLIFRYALCGVMRDALAPCVAEWCAVNLT